MSGTTANDGSWMSNHFAHTVHVQLCNVTTPTVIVYVQFQQQLFKE